MTIAAGDHAPAHDPAPTGPGLWLCVLASGSAGNCAVLVARHSQNCPRRVVLIDAGLSPLRTNKLLALRGIRADEVDDIAFTHLDSDHCHTGWATALRPGAWRARLRIHRRHLGRAERMGLLYRHTEPFTDTLTIDDHLRADAGLESHDDLGVAAFRFHAELQDHAGPRTAHLGYATDVGHVTNALTGLLRGVDLLAIESNYCPRLQAASDRPEFLKQRITGGSGHLSNAESAAATAEINPVESLVLLHLSRQCNTPAHARAAHAACAKPLTITDQVSPTGWIQVHGRTGDRPTTPSPTIVTRARTLFDHLPRPAADRAGAAR